MIKKSMLVVLISFMMMAGCKTPEQAAYRATGAVVISVDAAMKGWGDYVRAGMATVQDQAKVRAAYEKYQAAVRSAKAVTDSILTNPSDRFDPTAANLVLSAVNNSKNQLVELINTLRKPTLKTP